MVVQTSLANSVGGLRAAARLNRARILVAARDVFVEQVPARRWRRSLSCDCNPPQPRHQVVGSVIITWSREGR
jgi:hypothetical protein